MIACAAITASAQTDSISTLISFHVPKAEPQVVHYPYITPISSHEELSHEVMQLNFSKADAAAKKLITTARRRRESTADFDKVVSICHKGENGLRGVDRVVIVDSVVVDKKEFLKAYPHAFLLVSHDESFLKQVADVVFYLRAGKITRYKGSFDHFLEQKELDLAQAEKNYIAQQRYIKKEEDFIAAHIVRATSAKAAVSSLSM